MKHYLSVLNNEQFEAATSINGRNFVIAGAGSGKTRCLVARVAYLLDNGIDGSEILLLTFTNKAAREMKSRIISLIGERAKDVTACTFHSFCAVFIRKNAELLSLNPNYTILDSPDMIDALGIVKQEFLSEESKNGRDFSLKDFPKTAIIAKIYEVAINNCVEYDDVIDKIDDVVAYKDVIKTILNNFKTYKKERNLLDYNDLLYYTERLLSNDELLRKNIDKHYKYISCDEYQDTNTIQNKILDLMSRDYPNLTVVGDDNQSIYAFRCANIDNILNFDKIYPECKTVILNQNYRSSQEILDTANAVMEYATEGKRKVLKGMFHGEKPKFIVKDNCYEEADYIIEQIKKRNCDLNDIAVICRSASQSYILEQKLNLNGIPYNKYGGLKFMEKSVIKDLLAFLRVFINTKDEIAMYRILQLYPGIGKVYATKISKIISENSFNEAIEKYKKRAFSKFLTELLNVINEYSEKNLQEQMKYLVDEYYEQIVTRVIENQSVSLSKKSELLQELAFSMEDAKTLRIMTDKYRSTSRFLNDIVLDATVDEDTEDKLNITTIHSAKGLEYDIVFIMDCIDGVTPRTEEGSDEDPEELRCLYVAITRAKKELYFLVPRFYDYKRIQGIVSHFLNKPSILNTMQRNISNREIEFMCKKHVYNF